MNTILAFLMFLMSVLQLTSLEVAKFDLPCDQLETLSSPSSLFIMKLGHKLASLTGSPG
jgi:hypothetical protein